MKNCFVLFFLCVASIAVTAETSLLDVVKPRLAPIPPVIFRDRPFFPIGTYDYTLANHRKDRTTIDPGFLEAGGNFADFGHFGNPARPDYQKHCLPQVLKDLEVIKNDPRFADVALLVQFDGETLFDALPQADKDGIRFRPLDETELQKRRQYIIESLKKLSQYPNIIGYTMDEPENKIYRYYKKHHGHQWQRNQDSGLARKMVEWTTWVNPLVREFHPKAKLFPILAWWSTYNESGDMYDVLIANQYPKHVSDEEFSAPLYEVSYDAKCAVDAARLNGNGRSVIYMPPVFDTLETKTKYRTCTLAEQRYVIFAPITRGVMGIHGWRLNRASPEHREKVVFPVIKELSSLTPFFLGTWHDELVTSDHDFASVDYLKVFQSRVRLLDDEEDGEMQRKSQAVPDVTYCLRQHPDGSYLLLVVNNRREPIKVKFKLRLSGLPSELTERFHNQKVALQQDNIFQADFRPFDVHAYIFKSK